MGITKRDFMEKRLAEIASKVGINADDDFLIGMRKAEEEWEQINREQKLNFAARAWKYFHNLHTRKSRKNTLNGRET